MIKTQDTNLVLLYSAGVGRTGTFIGFDSLVREMEDKNSFNPFDCTLKMREKRKDMVQNDVRKKL